MLIVLTFINITHLLNWFIKFNIINKILRNDYCIIKCHIKIRRFRLCMVKMIMILMKTMMSI